MPIIFFIIEFKYYNKSFYYKTLYSYTYYIIKKKIYNFQKINNFTILYY